MVVSRRDFLIQSSLAVALTGTAETPTRGFASPASLPTSPASLPPSSAPSGTTLVLTITSSLNWYYAACIKGARSYATSQNLQLIVLENQGKFDKMMKQLTDTLNEKQNNVVVCADLASRLDGGGIVEFLTQKGVYFTTHASRQMQAHPWNYNPFFVANTSADHFAAGQKTADALLDSVGGRGRILALGGVDTEHASQKRRAGLESALQMRDGSKLLDFRAADWQASLAYDITRYWMARYKGEFDGIWAANDDMALGAIEALRVYGVAGKAFVTGIDGTPQAIDSIKAGELFATLPWDGYYMAGAGLALANAARTKQINPVSEPDEHREFYIRADILTRQGIGRYSSDSSEPHDRIDWRDFWSRADGQITD